MFALKGTELQRLFNILLGLMAMPDAQRGAVRSSEHDRLKMGNYKCALLHLRGLS
jgi:hypothetical protein